MNYLEILRRNWLLLLGLLCLAIPTILELVSSLWSKTDQEHGAIVFVLVCWIFLRELPALLRLPDQPVNWGWVLIIPSLLIYVLGRAQEIWMFEVGAFIPLIAGVSLLYKGTAGFRALLFPILFMIFIVPLPGFLMDALTNGLKQNISVIAENILYSLGYPVARSGVTLTVGQYQLLVADACSGINSLFSLLALGFIYLYLQQYNAKLRNILLMIAIAPVAIIANIIRVMILVLVTYYFGDAAGQGVIHGVAGIILFIIALLLMLSIDKLLSIFFSRQ